LLARAPFGKTGATFPDRELNAYRPERNGKRDGLRARGHAQALHGALNVLVRGGDGNPQLLRDAPIAMTMG
jgi:hypothetical protein